MAVAKTTSDRRIEVPDGFVRITSPALTRALVVRLGEGAITVTDGGSDFEETVRPRRRSSIAYVGMRLWRLNVPLLLDGWRYNPLVPNAGVASPKSVEPIVQLLESLTVSRHGMQGGPSPIRLWGAVPHKTVYWYIEALDWGTNVIYQGAARVRQDVTLRLVQKQDVDLAASEAQRRPKTKTSYRVVAMPAGSTLRDVASVMLGSAARWREIRRMNGKRWTTAKVAAGTKLKVPRA